MIAYDDEDDAVAIANDTVYGLAGYVWGGDAERAMEVARRLRAGMVAVNGGSFIGAELPFGGRRQSGMGREWGVAGFEEFLDLKSVGVGSLAVGRVAIVVDAHSHLFRPRGRRRAHAGGHVRRGRACSSARPPPA